MMRRFTYRGRHRLARGRHRQSVWFTEPRATSMIASVVGGYMLLLFTAGVAA